MTEVDGKSYEPIIVKNPLTGQELNVMPIFALIQEGGLPNLNYTPRGLADFIQSISDQFLLSLAVMDGSQVDTPTVADTFYQFVQLKSIKDRILQMELKHENHI